MIQDKDDFIDNQVFSALVLFPRGDRIMSMAEQNACTQYCWRIEAYRRDQLNGADKHALH